MGTTINAFATPEENALADAIVSGDHAEVRTLLQAGTRPDALGEGALDFLSLAIANGETRIFRTLLEAGAISDPKGKNVGQALHTAIVSGDMRWVRELHEAGASLDNHGGGDLLLKKAYYAKNAAAVRYFLDNGADIDSPTLDKGTVALALAKVKRYDEVVELLERGASPFAIDIAGNTIGRKAEDHGARRLLAASSPLEKSRKRTIEILRAAGFPFPAPTAKEAELLVKQGRWPPQ